MIQYLRAIHHFTFPLHSSCLACHRVVPLFPSSFAYFQVVTILSAPDPVRSSAFLSFVQIIYHFFSLLLFIFYLYPALLQTPAHLFLPLLLLILFSMPFSLPSSLPHVRIAPFHLMISVPSSPVYQPFLQLLRHSSAHPVSASVHD